MDMKRSFNTEKSSLTMTRTQRVPLLLSVAAAVSVMSGSVMAQSLLEEVVVTAQKRDQGLQDVGIAVSAFTGDQLRAFDATDSFDIAAYTPGVHISGNLAGQNTQFTIRGVTQNDFNDIIESPNAVYLDEGYVAIAQAQTFALLDLDRVEILKGPQGTLFGRNATGGVVSFFSKKPNFEEFEGFVQADFGQFDVPNNANRMAVEAAIGGPISDSVAFRAAIRYSEQDPYLENLYPQGQPQFNVFGAPPFAIGNPGEGAGADLGDDDTIVGRFTLGLRPTDRLEITLSANYADSELSTGPYQSKPTIALVEDINGRSEVYNVIDTPANETRLSILTNNGNDTGLDGGGDGLVDSPLGRATVRRLGFASEWLREQTSLAIEIRTEMILPSLVILPSTTRGLQRLAASTLRSNTSSVMDRHSYRSQTTNPMRRSFLSTWMQPRLISLLTTGRWTRPALPKNSGFPVVRSGLIGLLVPTTSTSIRTLQTR